MAGMKQIEIGPTNNRADSAPTIRALPPITWPRGISPLSRGASARLLPAFACGALLLVAAGCVERTMKITTQPPGATVVVNDEEVGLSPVKFSFMWHGDYDIVIRKEGYETLKTHFRVNPPWYELPPFDLFAEHFVPGTIHDDHVLPEYELTKAEAPAIGDVVKRATELRDRTLYEGGK